jgi:hypothetical protein
MADLLKVKIVGPAGADVAGAMKQLSGSEASRLAYTVVRLGVVRIRARAFATFTSTGVGRAIWGSGDPSKGTIGGAFAGGVLKAIGVNNGPRPGSVIKTKVIKRANDGFILAFSVKGMPAMQEEGGQTKAHTIAPKNAPALVYRTKWGALRRSTEPVEHPGGPIRKVPYLAPAIDAEAARIASDMAKALDGLIERATSKKKTAAA